MENQLQSNIYFLSDWEKDIWTKVYFTVARRGVFNYTFDKNDAKKKSYELSLGEIFFSTIKMPKRAKRKLPSEKQTTTATTESKSVSET